MRAAGEGVLWVVEKLITRLLLSFCSLLLPLPRRANPAAFLVCYRPLAVKNIGVELTSSCGALSTRERPRHSSRNLFWERSLLDAVIRTGTSDGILLSVQQFMSS